MDRALALAGWFRLRPIREARRIVSRQQPWKPAPGHEVTIEGPPGSHVDLAVWLAILWLARHAVPGPPDQMAPRPLPPKSRRPPHRYGRRSIQHLPADTDLFAGEELNPANRALRYRHLTIRTSLSELVDIMAEAGGDSVDIPSRFAVRRSLDRLASISIRTGPTRDSHGAPSTQTALLAARISAGPSPVILTLNYRATAAILGRSTVPRDRAYAPICLRTYLHLSPEARLVYAWLMGWFGPSLREGAIRVSTLTRHIYGVGEEDDAEGPGPVHQATERRRWNAVARALPQIRDGLGWAISDRTAETGDEDLVVITPTAEHRCFGAS